MSFTVIDLIFAVSTILMWTMIVWICSGILDLLSQSYNNEETQEFELNDMPRPPMTDNYEHNRRLLDIEETQHLRRISTQTSELNDMSQPLIMVNYEHATGIFNNEETQEFTLDEMSLDSGQCRFNVMMNGDMVI